MMVGGQSYQTVGRGRPWTFYALAALFGLFLLFLYGPMLVIYILSFQGPDGGVTFPMVGTSLVWFEDILKPGQMANIPVSFGRSIALASIVSLLTVAIGRRGPRFPAALPRLWGGVLSGGRQPGNAEPLGRLRHRAGLSGSRH